MADDSFQAVPRVPSATNGLMNQAHAGDHSASSSIQLDADEFIYHFQASQALPSIDLSRTLARYLLPPTAYTRFKIFMTRHFHHLVMIYRLGVVDLALLLFLPKSSIRSVLTVIIIPCSLSVFTSVFFMSTDVLQLLAQCYEFWFLAVINASNWILLATILNDSRAVLCWSAWLAYQSVIMIDANYRTYPTAISSTIVSTPLVIAIAFFTAAGYIRDGNYYNLYLETIRVSDSADLIAFTTSTLVVFLVKLAILKKTQMHHTFEGHHSIPCVIIKSNLRLAPHDAHANADRRGAIAGKQRRGEGTRPRMLLCTPPLPFIDAFRTVLPHRFWKHIAHLSPLQAQIVRVVFYSVGAAGLALQSYSTLVAFIQDRQQSALNSEHLPRQFDVANNDIKTIMILGALFSVIFCGGFSLFYQRDLLWLLCRNFDFLFCVAQTITFVVCHCDLMNWNLERSATLLGWLVWALWIYTLDAATPIIKDRLFRFRKRWVASSLAINIVGAGAIGVFASIMPGIGYHDRVLFSYEFANHASFAIHTKSILLGRVVTIVLWNTRQAFLLWTRDEDELNFIRGSVEYLSVYHHFPSPARVDAIREQTTEQLNATHNQFAVYPVGDVKNRASCHPMGQ